MAADHPKASPGADRYEKRDAHAGWIFGIVLGLFLCGIIVLLVVHWLAAAIFPRIPNPSDQWSGAQARLVDASNETAFPKLQLAPQKDLKQFRAREDAELNSYGWINQTAGVVRIPVERAMELVLARGLPVRAGVGHSRLGPTPFELQQQRTNATQMETVIPR